MAAAAASTTARRAMPQFKVERLGNGQRACRSKEDKGRGQPRGGSGSGKPASKASGTRGPGAQRKASQGRAGLGWAWA